MTNPLNDIREGMSVLDRHGNKIGEVEWVKMTDEDPDTVSVEQTTVDDYTERNPNLIDIVAESFRIDEVPDALRGRLLREGFVRVDADGLFAADRYVLPDQITRVAGDDVVLNVEKSDLIKRH